MADLNNRRVQSETPVGLIVLAVSIGIIVIAGIFYAVWISGTQITDARLRGTVVAKEFVPLAEEQITLGEQGLSARKQDGEYILKVRVRKRDGTEEDYDVWLAKEQYESVNVGDEFDVGPYLVR